MTKTINYRARKRRNHIQQRNFEKQTNANENILSIGCLQATGRFLLKKKQ